MFINGPQLDVPSLKNDPSISNIRGTVKAESMSFPLTNLLTGLVFLPCLPDNVISVQTTQRREVFKHAKFKDQNLITISPFLCPD